MRASRNLMALEPGSLMHRMFRDVNQLFDRRSGLPINWPVAGFDDFPWSPDVEMAERDHHLTVTVDLPGLTREEVSVELGAGYLTVSGERSREKGGETKAADWVRSERAYGAFSRTVPVPDGIRPEEVTATFTNGVLEIVMPLPASEAAGPKTIPVGETRAGAPTTTGAAA